MPSNVTEDLVSVPAPAPRTAQAPERRRHAKGRAGRYSQTSIESTAGPTAGRRTHSAPGPRPLAVRILGSVVSWVSAILCVIAVSLALVVALASHFAPSGQYQVFGHPVLSVLSGSMSPRIRTGDLIVDDAVSGPQAAQLHVGQIITFGVGAHAQRYFTHRIVNVHTADGHVSYTTKGDANNAPDASPVPSSNVVGVYQWKIDGGGYALNALHATLTIVLLGLVALLVFAGGPTWRWARRRLSRS